MRKTKNIVITGVITGVTALWVGSALALKSLLIPHKEEEIAQGTVCVSSCNVIMKNSNEDDQDYQYAANALPQLKESLAKNSKMVNIYRKVLKALTFGIMK